MNQEPLTRAAKVILWVCGHMEELKAQGLVVGGPVVTPKGLSHFDQLSADFRPSDDEIRQCLSFLQRLSQ